MSPDHGFDDSGVSPGRITIKEEEYQSLVQAAALAGVSWGTPPSSPRQLHSHKAQGVLKRSRMVALMHLAGSWMSRPRCHQSAVRLSPSHP